MNRAVLSVGSNIQPERHVRRALALLRREGWLRSVSAFVHTAPLGITDQPDFLNGAVLVETELERAALKHRLRGIEDRLGRLRQGPRYGPRTIDLDIVVWNGWVVDRDFYERDFVRHAVLELLPAVKSGRFGGAHGAA
ncbi:2-amino-4-hydroxy-6-hydroxymethyldihydropteridine diphosphokinase [bacterium]|nr:2-amino-4-hydroxy-6-hydroxymethyldihydropteridine diphosphokinase [bacterium]